MKAFAQIKASDGSPCPLSDALAHAFHAAALGSGRKLPPEILSMEGMSGWKYRLLINNLIAYVPDARYLEVGSWQGSTLCSAIHGNSVRATAIDNWSLFGGPKHAFLANLERFRTPQAYVNFIESDFRQVDFASLGKFDIYMFDGPHEEHDQYDGILRAAPALAKTAILIVDDWNWEQVRAGTMRAIAELKFSIRSLIEIRTSIDNTLPELRHQQSEWHNGYFIAVVSRQSA